jgi:hypothetical protein
MKTFFFQHSIQINRLLEHHYTFSFSFFIFIFYLFVLKVSPEVLKNNPATFASDIWALGFSI